MLKYKWFFDTWDCAFVATASMHGLDNLLNLNFFPRGLDMTALFQEQQKFLYDTGDAWRFAKINGTFYYDYDRIPNHAGAAR